ncbi:MAG: ATP-binding protein [Methylobacter sp.]
MHRKHNNGVSDDDDSGQSGMAGQYKVRSAIVLKKNIMPRKIAVSHDKADVLRREDLVAAREYAAGLREKAVQLREKKAIAREQEIDAAATVQAASDEHMVTLQQANAHLVVATIEAQKLAEQIQIAKAQLESANLAKSDFLSRMSHELRTPLNAILGFAQLLESGNPPPTETQILRLDQILKAGWYLLELINEILDLAVIESGKLSLSRESVSLIDVIHECRGMIEAQAQQHDIRLIFHPFDPGWFANADRTRVKQALINLLSNAIKYNREHGSVEVQCIESGPDRLRIRIKDSGDGLEPEQLMQLFQPFNRLGQENGAVEGTGIGLVVTKQLVEQMGGAIGVDSTVGVGSEFWIDLVKDVPPQFASGHALSSDHAPHTQGNPAQRTLLYVEDNPANLMLVEQIIAGHPHVRILSAQDGHLGIALARAHRPDVILMDINLPGIGGLQTLQILSQDPAVAHIPVIALSANAMFRDIEKGLAAGFFRYLTKPIKINEFISAFDDALNFSETELSHTNETGPLR